MLKAGKGARRVRRVKFELDLTQALEPDVVRALAPAGVDADELIAVLVFARDAGLPRVVAGTETARGVVPSWWAETPLVITSRGVNHCASLVGALELLAATSALVDPRRRHAACLGYGVARPVVLYPYTGAEVAARVATGPPGKSSGWASAAVVRQVAAPEVAGGTADADELRAALNGSQVVVIAAGRGARQHERGGRYYVLPGGEVAQLHVAYGKPVQLVGFRRELGSLSLDVSLAAFYDAPLDVTGLYAVFERGDGGRSTLAEPVTSVRAVRAVADDWPAAVLRPGANR